MTEQELKEQIAKIFVNRPSPNIGAHRVLVTFKKAGYMSPEEVKGLIFEVVAKKTAECEDRLREAGWMPPKEGCPKEEGKKIMKTVIKNGGLDIRQYEGGMDNKKQKIISILKEFSAWDTEGRIKLTNQYADEILASLVVDEDAGLEYELLKLTKKIEQVWADYKTLQNMYRYYTGKEHECLK